MNARWRCIFGLRVRDTPGRRYHRAMRVLLVVLCSLPFIAPASAQGPGTRVANDGEHWLINGRVTYPGAPAEGRLMNVRMVNTTFEDDRPPDAWPAVLPASFDPDTNTSRFIARMPDYLGAGVRAFTLNLQGGSPDYEGAHNSAFNADGTVRPASLARIARVIDAADREGAVVILGLFYQRQHGRAPTHLPRALAGREAIRAAVVNAVRWVRERGWANVVIEIANEYAHAGFKNWNDGPWLQTPEAQVELMALARSTHPALLVSTSGMGSAVIDARIAQAADFILLHTNSTPIEAYAARIADARRHGKPVVINEDDKVGPDGAEAARRAIAAGASWGFMHSRVNQYAPFSFNGPDDDPEVYRTIERLTTRAK
jgi:hypothetical protein